MFSVHTVTVVCTIVGASAAVIGCVWKFSRDISAGNGRVYERINQVEQAANRDIGKAEETARRDTDEAEETSRDTYRTKEVCDERHKTVSTQLKTLTDSAKEIHKDVKSLLRKNGIQPTG